MKKYGPDRIRNIALAAHQDTGKTTLAEAMLYSTGVISRMGRVEDGNTTMDAAPDEHERQISIQTGLAFNLIGFQSLNLSDFSSTQIHPAGAQNVTEQVFNFNP